MKAFRTPVKNARGLGSAHDGTHHWWVQRITALALIPLGLWFVASLVGLLQADYAAAVSWLAQPVNAVLLVLLLGVMFRHSYLGIQVVVEDYVHGSVTKLVTLVLLQFAHLVLAAAGIFVVLRIAFGA